MTPKLLEPLASFLAVSPPLTQSLIVSPTMDMSNLDLCIQVVYMESGKPEMKEVYAHRAILAAKSQFFRLQLEQLDNSGPLTTLTIDLSVLKNPVTTFQQLLVYLYTNEIQIDLENCHSLLYLSKMCDLPNLQKQIDSFHNENSISALLENKQSTLLVPPKIHSEGSSPMASASPSVGTFSPAPLNAPMIPQLNPAICAAYLQLLQQQQAQVQAQGQQAFLNNLFQASLAAQSVHFNNPTLLANSTITNSHSSIFPQFNPLPTTLPSIENENRVVSESEQSEARSLASSCSSANQPNAPSPPFDNLGDLLVPSNDKEGWCRNKKYIQTVPNGYRCTVCNKVYGRYNSVSYHVTIYHRNPPIRCEEPGCQFTTREARYIYFHKYYRHNVPLPESIDTASRKCPFFNCRHVSKSPAMLEKHIARHVSDCSKNGSYDCPNCPFKTTEHRSMFDHLRVHQIGTDCGESGKRSAPGPSHNVFPCDMCSYKGRTLSNLENHRVSKHHATNVMQDDFKSNIVPTQPNSLEAASLNFANLKALFPDNFLAMLNVVNANK